LLRVACMTRAATFIPGISLLCTIFVGGCVKTEHVKAATYQIGSPPVAEHVVTPGIYRVKWTAHKSLHAVPSTDRYVNVGETLGFETALDGRVYAYAGGYCRDLGIPPPKAKKLLWHHESKQETEFGVALS